MCVRLYFVHFDAIMPILHDKITNINNHWILALAVSAIGCQYAEADEYSQMVEPMHEFLRRAILIETNNKSLESIGQDKACTELAQAIALSQIGMLYSGSSRLLGFAKAQHSTVVQLAQALMLSITDRENALADLQAAAGPSTKDQIWIDLMLDECRRRICYSLWVRCISSNAVP